MNLTQLLDQWDASPSFRANITAWHRIPAQAARTAPFPASLDPRLPVALRARGVQALYTHQAQAVETAAQGRSYVVVTPTASGKTLAYNLPVLNTMLQNPDARALYLFPTKALAQDQVTELQELIDALGVDIKTFTYDGDTSPTARQAIRTAGHVVVTNPDMLHTGILPHHTKWVKLFENLQYVVIDEVHQYRGVFGSHLANVIRRLRRLCRFYGSNPIFIMSSATIANPQELASRLAGEDVFLIDGNGAPRGEKHLILYNPPVVNQQLGIRRSSLLEAKRVAADLLKNHIQTIVFARSRLNVEVMLTYLHEATAGYLGTGKVRGYRGGYLPLERRAIEKGLRQGDVLGVVSTSALELGIDIGQLDACVIAGYPGSVSSVWQQAGRAGRRQGTSAAVLVASSAPLDQYLITHPEYFLELPPEHGYINPDNLLILISHLKCAAFELPFEDGESFGVETTGEILGFLEEEKVLRHAGGRWHWMSDNFPAEEISLRSAASENFVIIDTTEARNRVIGEMDRMAAMTMLHQDAIYIHAGRQFHVDNLDWHEKKAYVRAVDVDYYTDANLAVTLKVLDVIKEGTLAPRHTVGAAPGAEAAVAVAGGAPASPSGVARQYGEVMVTAMATIFKKIRLHTHENIGWGKIHLPEEQMHSAASWISFPPELEQAFDTPSELESGLVGLGNVLSNLAPVLLLCDPKDIRPVTQVRSPFTDRPSIFLYDSYPGGIGLAEKLYDMLGDLLQTGRELVEACPCEAGCPSCVGPANEVGPTGKAAALRLLALALDGEAPAAKPGPGDKDGSGHIVH
ncbi:MAG: DEAD/DEAH box helicase [Symbiobacteriia bacterium]